MIDVVGYIPQIDNSDPDDPVITWLPGWHINSAAPLYGLDDYSVTPTVPHQVLAGVPTYHYRFDDEEQAKMLLNWTEDVGYAPTFKPSKAVPKSVTRRQARQQLLLMGLLNTVEAAIADIPDDTERGLVCIYWEDSNEFERQNPFLIQLAGALGLDEEALDDAFIAASQL